MDDGSLQPDGFCILHGAVARESTHQLITTCDDTFANETDSVRTRSISARSSRGHVYAARNLIKFIPEVSTIWQRDPLLRFLRSNLGDEFGLVRALFFDKPPDRTWNLPWHKDTSIAVKDNSIKSRSFSRPTTKAGVPHLIASDDILKRMLTLRLHLDEVNNENGPLRVVPESHLSSTCEGVGIAAAVTIYADVGDVLVMRPLISHASGPSIEGTSRHRRILHLEFAASRWLPDGVMWHDFVSAAR